MGANRRLFTIINKKNCSDAEKAKQLVDLWDYPSEDKTLVSSDEKEDNLDVDAFNERGFTALMEAAWHGYTQCVKELIALTANFNLQSKQYSELPYNRTALMLAAMQGHTDCVSELVKAGAGQALIDSDGNSAFLFAGKGNKDCLSNLLQYGAQIDFQNPLKMSALMIAARDGKEDNVAFLLTKGADRKLTDANNLTALDHAYLSLQGAKGNKNHFSIIQLLCPAIIDSPARMQSILKYNPEQAQQFKSLLISSQDSNVHFCLGVLAERERSKSSGNTDKFREQAIAHYEAARAKQALPGFGYRRLGKLYQESNDFFNATQIYTQGIGKNDYSAFLALVELTHDTYAREQEPVSEAKTYAAERFDSADIFSFFKSSGQNSKKQTIRPITADALLVLCHAQSDLHPTFKKQLPEFRREFLDENAPRKAYSSPLRALSIATAQ